MSSGKSNLSLDSSGDELIFREIFFELWKKKIIMISTILVSFILFTIYAYTLPNIYSAKTLIRPAQDHQSSLTTSLAGYGSLANFAGFNLSPAGDANTQVAIETIKSFKFFHETFLPVIKLEDLMAVESWDPRLNIINYDQSVYLVESNIWVREVNFPKKPVPSPQEAHEEFLKNFLNINKNNQTGFIEISIDHQSPYIAKYWLDILLEKINSVLREEKKQQTLQSINFLGQQISGTSLAEVKQVLASILQKETEKLMLIEVNKDFVFQAIDPPIIPETKSKPDRLLIPLLGILFGMILATLFILARYFKDR